MHDKLYETMQRLQERAKNVKKKKKLTYTKYGQSYTFLHLCEFMERQIGQHNFNACIEVVHMFLCTIARLLTNFCEGLKRTLKKGGSTICSAWRAQLNDSVRNGELMSVFPVKDRGERLCELFWSLNAIVNITCSGTTSLLEQWSFHLQQVMYWCAKNKPIADDKVKHLVDSMLEDNGLAEHTAHLRCPDKKDHLKVLCHMLGQCILRSRRQQSHSLFQQTLVEVSRVFSKLGVERKVHYRLGQVSYTLSE